MCCLFILFQIKTSICQVLTDVYQLSTASADLCSEHGMFMHKNPGCIGSVESPRVQIAQIIPFSIVELQSNSFSIVQQIGKITYGFDFVQNGKSYFNTNQLSLTSGLKITDKLKFGSKIIYHLLSKIDDKREHLFSIEIGLVQQINKKFQYGFQLNYLTNTISTEIYRSSIKMGICYQVDKRFNSYFSIEMIENGLIRSNVAVVYQIHQNIGLRLGWNTFETSFGSGLYYHLKRYKIEMGTTYHPQLGMSYGMGLGYALGKNFI